MSNNFYNYGYNNSYPTLNFNDNNNNNFYEIRLVICPVCHRQAHVKPTKTHRLMLRCDLCRALMFANAETSQQYLLNLPEYREYRASIINYF